MHWRRKWQPTPVFLPGESRGRGTLVGCSLGVAQSQTRLTRLSSSSSRLEYTDSCSASCSLIEMSCCNRKTVLSKDYSCPEKESKTTTQSKESGVVQLMFRIVMKGNVYAWPSGYLWSRWDWWCYRSSFSCWGNRRSQRVYHHSQCSLYIELCFWKSSYR